MGELNRGGLEAGEESSMRWHIHKWETKGTEDDLRDRPFPNTWQYVFQECLRCTKRRSILERRPTISVRARQWGDKWVKREVEL